MTEGRLRSSGGFTLIELVTVMILVGILSFVAMPRFADRTFDERGFHDAVKATVQHARHLAVASRRYTCVNVTVGAGAAGIVEVMRDTALPESGAAVGCGPGCAAGAACTAIPLPAPGRGCAANNQVCAPTGVAVLAGSSSLIFDPAGRLVTAAKAVEGAALTIGVTNQPGVTVQPETGFAQ